jgi:hypothetical protein
MEMAAAKAGYDLARAEEEVADKAFLEAETLLKRRQGSIFWSKTNIYPPPPQKSILSPQKNRVCYSPRSFELWRSRSE